MTDPRTVATALELIAMGIVAVTTRSIEASGVDLTFPQWRVLIVLGHRPEGVGMTEIASRTGGTLSSTSRMVRRMVRAGFVSIAKHEGDRRVTVVRETPAGLDIRDRVLTHRHDYLVRAAEAVGTISSAEADVLARIGKALAQYT